jgi:hypothetical protein
MMTDCQNDNALDLLWGANEVGRAIGRDERQAVRLLQTGAIPARKVGGKWVVERGALRAFFGRPELE